MDKGYDLFISYSRKDSGLVLEIAEKLTESGYDVWIDKKGINSGDEFRTTIVKAIRNSDVFLFIKRCK